MIKLSSRTLHWHMRRNTAILIWIHNEWKEEGSQVIAYRSLCFPLQSTVCVYSSSAASLFLGLWPEVHLCVANQQKMTDCDRGRTFHIQNPCSVVAVLQFSQLRNISKLCVRVCWLVNSSIVQCTNAHQ